ncbi:MAG TPA: dipeptidase [Bryobacteraceae bacterium]|nr:dipeptidase [Bryobacteraceae bacterium]
MNHWLLLLCLVTAVSLAAQPRAVSDDEVMKVHRSALLIDTHNDVPMRIVEGFDIGKASSKGHTDLPRLRQGGVGAVFFAAYVSAQYARSREAAHQALERIDAIRHDIAGRYPNDFALSLTAADIEAARRQGKIAALIGIEGGHAIEDSLRVLRSFHALGARYVTLTHSNTNNWADSSGDIDNPKVKHHNGLATFGREVVREMNRLGMIVDVSHVSDKTFWDVLETSQAPVFASHSSCRALASLHRNMTDEMIVAMAKKGGVIQINFACEFLSEESAQAAKKLWPEYERLHAAARERFKDDSEGLKREVARLEADARRKTPRAKLTDVVAHIDHVVKLAGIDAVGIGTDYDGITCAPEGLEDVSKFPNLTRALLEKGYSADNIRKIYGGNTLRLMRAVERAAK